MSKTAEMKQTGAPLVPIAALALVLVWVAAPFVSDRPAWAEPVFWTYTAVAVLWALFVALRTRRWWLVAAALLTAVAWPLVLLVGLSAFGI